MTTGKNIIFEIERFFKSELALIEKLSVQIIDNLAMSVNIRTGDLANQDGKAFEEYRTHRPRLKPTVPSCLGFCSWRVLLKRPITILLTGPKLMTHLSQIENVKISCQNTIGRL